MESDPFHAENKTHCIDLFLLAFSFPVAFLDFFPFLTCCFPMIYNLLVTVCCNWWYTSFLFYSSCCSSSTFVSFQWLFLWIPSLISVQYDITQACIYISLSVIRSTLISTSWMWLPGMQCGLAAGVSFSTIQHPCIYSQNLEFSPLFLNMRVNRCMHITWTRLAWLDNEEPPVDTKFVYWQCMRVVSQTRQEDWQRLFYLCPPTSLCITQWSIPGLDGGA
jgi:hypothetical protein